MLSLLSQPPATTAASSKTGSAIGRSVQQGGIHAACRGGIHATRRTGMIQMIVKKGWTMTRCIVHTTTSTSTATGLHKIGCQRVHVVVGGSNSSSRLDDGQCLFGDGRQRPGSSSPRRLGRRRRRRFLRHRILTAAHLGMGCRYPYGDGGCQIERVMAGRWS